MESPPLLLMSFRIPNSLLELASVSSGKVTVPGLTWPGISTSNNLVSSTADPFRDLPVINRVSNVNTQLQFPPRTGCCWCV